MSQPGFCWERTLVAPDKVGTTGHIDNIQIASLLFDSWMAYMNDGLAADDVFGQDVRPIVRRITADFDAEVHPREELVCSVRAVSRSRRSFTLEQALWRPSDEGRLATGTVVLVTIEPASGRAVEVPSLLWDAVERREGRPIPVAVSS